MELLIRLSKISQSFTEFSQRKNKLKINVIKFHKENKTKNKISQRARSFHREKNKLNMRN